MAHSYTKILIHYVFSTKNREKIMTAPLQERLWAYMGGIAKGTSGMHRRAATKLRPGFVLIKITYIIIILKQRNKRR